MNLIWSGSIPWLLSNCIHKVSGALSYPGAHTCGPNGQITMTSHIYRPRCFHELDLESIHQVVAELQHLQVSKSTYYTCGYAHGALMGKWPWHRTSTGQHSTNKLDLGWIRRMVVELQLSHFTSTGQGNSNEFDLEWIKWVVTWSGQDSQMARQTDKPRDR